MKSSLDRKVSTNEQNRCLDSAVLKHRERFGGSTSQTLTQGMC